MGGRGKNEGEEQVRKKGRGGEGEREWFVFEFLHKNTHALMVSPTFSDFLYRNGGPS